MATSTLKVNAPPGKQEILMTRIFDAPRELVFKAYTDPKAIPQWWGRRGDVTKVDRMEVREGGRWRFVSSREGSEEFAFHGVYHAILAPERIVQTFEFEGVPGHVQLETATFEETGGRTKLTAHSVFQSVADRDAMIEAGMESGAAETLDRLEELLKNSEQ